MFLDNTNKNQYVLWAYYVPAAVFNSFHGFSHLILAIGLWDRDYYPHLEKEETESQRIGKWSRPQVYTAAPRLMSGFKAGFQST